MQPINQAGGHHEGLPSSPNPPDIAALVTLINQQDSFTTVAEAILIAVCTVAQADEAELHSVEYNSSPLRRAQVRLKERDEQGSPGTTLGIQVRGRGQLVGMLNIHWADNHPLTTPQREQLGNLANLAALLIQRERNRRLEAEIEGKVGQFDRHKEQFAALVSHQLRTPLTSIKGFAQLAGKRQQRGDLEAVSRYITTIQQEANRLAAIVSNLMLVSQMEVSLLGIRRGLLSLHEIVEQAISTLGHHHRAVESQLDASLPFCHADPVTLQQVLHLLLTHLLAHPSGERLVITAAPNGEYLNLALELTAKGDGSNAIRLEDVTLDHAVDNTEVNSPTMSLYMAKNLTEAMGGQFGIVHHDGGLRYHIGLPLAAR